MALLLKPSAQAALAGSLPHAARRTSNRVEVARSCETAAGSIQAWTACACQAPDRHQHLQTDADGTKTELLSITATGFGVAEFSTGQLAMSHH